MTNTDQAERYREIERLGVGGMATVTLAEDTVLGRLVALKRVHASGDERGALRLKREALVGASLNHPNLVSVFDARAQDDGDVMIVMEYVPGDTLADLIRSDGPLAPEEALRILRGIGAGLDAIHARGIVHRDVKPANVLLGSDGSVKLADLGVADVGDRTRITNAGAVVGTFSYMAPEQLDGAEPTPRMDVYALAAVAYELLSGEKARPETNPLALAHAIATLPPPDLRRVQPRAPRDAASVLQRGMSADPATRPRTAGELVTWLERAFEPSPATQAERPVRRRAAAAAARPVAPPRPPAHARRRSPGLVLLILLALIAAAAAIAIAVTSPGSASHTGASGTSRAGSSSARRHAAARTTTAHRAPSTTSPPPSTSSTTASSSTSSTTTPSAGSPAPSGAPAPGTSPPSGGITGSPPGVVQTFYEAAAQHRYSAAWTLADDNLRNQLGGYQAFQHQMSSVRSITFHRAQQVGGTSGGAATVAVQTTSVQTSRTQQCQGTVRTVRSGGSWRLDAIAINCS